MSEPADFDARRWQEKVEPQSHSPLAALREAIRQIEAGEAQCDHVIVVIGAERDDLALATWLQAGTFTAHAQIGLLERVKMAMVEECS